MLYITFILSFFFFNDTAPTEIYTLSLHDALPISDDVHHCLDVFRRGAAASAHNVRSEEHTSELQSPMYLVCRLLLEKKKKKKTKQTCSPKKHYVSTSIRLLPHPL